MESTTKNLNKLPNYFDYLGDWNPQFLREIKGRLNPKSIIITIAISIAVQFTVIISLLSRLPDASYDTIDRSAKKIYSVATQYSRYCTGAIDGKATRHSYQSILCTQDMHHNWVINWQLFWFDTFVILSIIGIALLLILGTYFLINNTIAEQKQGTLNLVRLSPQSATDILIGKILGVPILLYIFVGLGLPLQTIAAWQSQIPLSLIIAGNLAIIASCVFFYSAGLLISFVVPKSIVAWVVVFAIALFLGFTTILSSYKYEMNTKTLIDWLFVFNPNNLLLYLGKATGIPYHHFDYADFNIFGRSSTVFRTKEPIFYSNVLFYGQALWSKIGVGIGLVIANYCLWTYWLWQGLKRRFYNPENTVISKQQSYWITGYFTAIALGFSLQTPESYFFEKMALLQFTLLILSLGLIFALTPQRQTLYDWARYRHQMNQQGNVLWRELIFGEKSPSNVAITINLLIATLYIIPSLLIFSLNKDAIVTFWNLILVIGTILVYAAIVQWMLLGKSKQRVFKASTVIISLIVAPPILLSVFELTPYKTSLPWLLTSFPFVAIENVAPCTIGLAILGQWLAITLLSIQTTRKLRQAGRSETYKIVSG